MYRTNVKMEPTVRTSVKIKVRRPVEPTVRSSVKIKIRRPASTPAPVPAEPTVRASMKIKVSRKAVVVPVAEPAPTNWERPSHWKTPETLGQEVEQLIAEWYGCQGLEVPSEHDGIGAKIDEAEREYRRQEEQAVIEAEKAIESAPAGDKPEFGTPEFWAWARKRKAEKNAERAEQGLPPLPTKKEKDAAKAAKAAEKAAKAAEKEAKAAEKAAKAAEKEAKAAEKAAKAAEKAAKKTTK